jgi:hypothetical protein
MKAAAEMTALRFNPGKSSGEQQQLPAHPPTN